MPRVTTHTARKSKYDRRCTGCGKSIEEGQAYFHWTRRVGPKRGSFRHVACGRPRPTELSSRKTAQVEEAVGDYTTPELSYDLKELADHPDALDLDTTPFEDAVDSVCGVAEEVADEYESGADNMPESLQYGEQAEAMREVANELRTWAEDLRAVADETLTVDLPSFDPDEDEETDWQGEVADTLQEAWDTRASDVDDRMGDMPEYQG